jgi:hypothetical protein
MLEFAVHVCGTLLNKKEKVTQRRSGEAQRDTELAFVNFVVFNFEPFVVKKRSNTEFHRGPQRDTENANRRAFGI